MKTYIPKILVIFAILFSINTANSQTNSNDFKSTRVIKGAVIDKNGNPLPGATVSATGGAETVTTDADGTYSIEVPIWLKTLTASYPGLGDKKIKLKQDEIIFEMKPNNSSWFLDAAYSANFGDKYFSRVGLMGGYLGNWGGYAKILLPIGIDNYTPSATVGVIKQISLPIFLYMGAGYSPIFQHEANWWGEWWAQYDGVMIDIGTIYKVQKFNISVGYSITGDFLAPTHSIQLSVGYCF